MGVSCLAPDEHSPLNLRGSIESGLGRVFLSLRVAESGEGQLPTKSHRSMRLMAAFNPAFPFPDVTKTATDIRSHPASQVLSHR